jgi:hypothetical protein
MSKGLALVFILILTVSSLIMVNPAFASAQITRPSVPEFTVNLVNNSIVLTIKNQPFTPETLSGETTTLYYNVQSKLHSSQDWTYWFLASDGYPTQDSGSKYTVLSYGWGGGFIFTSSHGIEIPSGSQVDFQVQAMNGYLGREIVNASLGAFGVPWVFKGETSDWSNQTLLIPPQISVLSPQAGNYIVSNVPLNFTADSSVSQIAYSLDGQKNVTIAGNTTLTGLSNGLHNITVYVNDTFGSTGKSETINFTVAVPFPITLIIASIVSVAVIGVGLLVYFKKRRRSQNL